MVLCRHFGLRYDFEVPGGKDEKEPPVNVSASLSVWCKPECGVTPNEGSGKGKA